MDQLKLTIGALFVAVTSSFAQGGTAVSTDARDHLGAVEQFVNAKKKELATARLQTCIFGCPQDPVKARRQIAKEAPKRLQQARAEVPLSDVLNALPLTLIDPVGKRVIMTGAPPIKVGETLEVAFGSDVILLRLEEVRSQGAYFRDMKTKKVDLCSLSKLPSGISQNNGKGTAGNGIHRVSPNKPKSIKLDLGSANLASQGPPPRSTR